MAGRRRQVERNLDRIYDVPLAKRVRDVAVAETFRSYVRYWIESFRLPGTDIDTIDAGVDVEGFEYIKAGLAAGNGVILALPHLGGWEWAAFWLTKVHGLEVSAVVELIEPPELAEWFVGLRESFGMNMIPLDANAGSACSRALRENRILCLLSDRDLRGGGIDVVFFGESTTLPGGPATLALRSGAPLLPVATYFNGRRRHRLVICPPIDTARHGNLRSDVARVTAELAQRLETLIRVAPEQWHLLQPNWPSDRV